MADINDKYPAIIIQIIGPILATGVCTWFVQRSGILDKAKVDKEAKGGEVTAAFEQMRLENAQALMEERNERDDRFDREVKYYGGVIDALRAALTVSEDTRKKDKLQFSDALEVMTQAHRICQNEAEEMRRDIQHLRGEVEVMKQQLNKL